MVFDVYCMPGDILSHTDTHTSMCTHVYIYSFK